MHPYPEMQVVRDPWCVNVMPTGHRGRANAVTLCVGCVEGRRCTGTGIHAPVTILGVAAAVPAVVSEVTGDSRM